MFGKSDQERIADTLALIQDVPDLTSAVRQQICMLVRGSCGRLLPAELKKVSRSMSVKASIAPGVDKGDEQQRRKRRAIVLLAAALLKARGMIINEDFDLTAAMALSTASLDAAFSDAMLKIAVVASPTGAQLAMQKLEAHPVEFLRRYRLFIKGSPGGGDRFTTSPNGNHRNVITYYFQYVSDNDQFLIFHEHSVLNGAAYTFSAVSIPAVHWTQVPGVGVPPHNFGGILGCEVAGANFMLTTQFTGCAFCWTDHAGLLRAAHISPYGGGTTGYPGGGKALAQQLLANGAMANAGNTALTVFGAGAGNAPAKTGLPFYPDTAATMIKWVTIIGLPKGGGPWRFYAQVVGDGGRILEARRIL